MTNEKQLDRLIDKVSRLERIYHEAAVCEKEELTFGAFEPKQPIYAPPEREKYRPIKKGETWGKEYGYCWFGASVTLPERFRGRRVFLACDTGAFESLIFVNGAPYGLNDYVPGNNDRLHRYLLLPFEGDKPLNIDVESYASHRYHGTQPYEGDVTFGSFNLEPVERTFGGFQLVTMHEERIRFADNLYLLNSLYRSLKSDDFLKSEAIRLYQSVYNEVDLLPDEITDDAALNRASEQIERFLAAKDDESKPYQAGMVGHSHLDTAWLWPVEETKRKAARTAATAVRLLKQYPDYKFVMSSVLYMDWFKTYYPALFEDVRALTEEGRFEPNGAVWVECDCNLIGGEALVRQFLYGQHFLRKEMGYEADCFWLPDTFGYSASLPQIMQKSNVKYFYTTKLSWNDTNRFPYDTFRWQGLDGSEVTAHFNVIHVFADPQKITERVNNIQNKYVTDKTLISYGYGDGGGGPEQTMVEYAVRSEHIRGIPKAKHVTISKFMQDIDASRLPAYSGELYLELHRGTLTSNHLLKRLNRRFESRLHDLEFVCAALKKFDKKTEIERLYKVLMLNQFHDILPGTSINVVNETAQRENAEGIAAAEQLTASLLKGKNESKSMTLLSTLGFAREETFTIDGAVPFADGAYTFTDVGGEQKTRVSAKIAPFSSAVLPLMQAGGSEEQTESAFTYTGDTLVTPRLKVRFDENNFIVGLYDISAERELCCGGLNRLTLYRDTPHSWDNWDIDADYALKGAPCTLKTCEVVISNAYEFRLRSTYSVGASSELVQDMVFLANSAEIDFCSRLNWQEQHYLLKALFETNLFTRTARSETQFGYVERSTLNNTAVEQAMFETCNHKWTDLSEINYGMTLMNDCKYGVSAKGGTLGLSLMKAGTHPDSTGDKGVKYFNYKISLHQGGFNFDNAIRPAYAYNYAPICVKGEVSVTAPAVCDKPGVIIETVKPAEDGTGTVLRLYESEGNHVKANLIFSEECDAYLCNLLEDELTAYEKTRVFPLSLSPFEIVTVKLKARG